MNKLEKIGCIKITDEQVYRNPLEIFETGDTEKLFELNNEQNKVYEGIKRRINKKAGRYVTIY